MFYICLLLIKLVDKWLFSYVVFVIFFFLQVYTYNVPVYVIMMLKVQ